MKRTLSLYIMAEITGLFLLGLTVFTLVLLMGRLIKLTDMVISHGVPFLSVCRMIVYLMPSFLVYTVPMAFLLAVLLSFARLSADNEVTVMKACGISLLQIMPPVLLCALVAVALGMYASVVGVPWGNSSFSSTSFSVLRQNVSATIREKVFWDSIPGIVLYTERYDEQRQRLTNVIIYDGRDGRRPLTIFADGGVLSGSDRDMRLLLRDGSIHAKGKEQEYRLINFGEYIMTFSAPADSDPTGRNPRDMANAELIRRMDDPATPPKLGMKMAAELHSRFALPCASLVFAVLAVPLGLQNRRSAKSYGFSISIGVLLLYYILLSLMSTLAEKGGFPALPALWLPNLLFLGLGCYLLRMASLERRLPVPSLAQLVRSLRGEG